MQTELPDLETFVGDGDAGILIDPAPERPDGVYIDGTMVTVTSSKAGQLAQGSISSRTRADLLSLPRITVFEVGETDVLRHSIITPVVDQAA